MGSDTHVRPQMGAEAMIEETPGAAGKPSQVFQIQWQIQRLSPGPGPLP